MPNLPDDGRQSDDGTLGEKRKQLCRERRNCLPGFLHLQLPGGRAGSPGLLRDLLRDGLRDWLRGSAPCAGVDDALDFTGDGLEFGLFGMFLSVAAALFVDRFQLVGVGTLDLLLQTSRPFEVLQALAHPLRL